MFPFLLPILLVIYGEFSNCKDTRFISRCLFYSYMFSIYSSTYAPTNQMGIAYSMIVMSGGLSFVIYEAEKTVTKFLFSITLITTIVSHYALYHNDYLFVLSIPFFAEHSHLIFRESILLALTSMTPIRLWSKEEYLFFSAVAFIWASEYFFL